MKSNLSLLAAVTLCINGVWCVVSAAELRIAPSPTNVVVAWPTNMTDFTLQFTDQLRDDSAWFPFLLASETNGPDRRVIDGSRVSARFFRLFSGGPPVPPQLNVTASSSVIAGQTTNIALNYSDSNGDIAFLSIIESNAWGVRRSAVPVTFTSISGTGGVAQLTLSAARLPFGRSDFTVQLHDLRSLTSAPVQFTMQVIGAASGGSAPSLSFATNGQPIGFGRPFDLFDRFKLSVPVSYSDPDGDLYRVRIRTILPGDQTNVVEETAAAFAMTGTGGVAQVYFLTWSNTSLIGTYTLELTAIDRNGNESAPVTHAVQLAFFSFQLPALRFSSFTPFQPASGGAGATVNLLGTFDLVASNLSVFINDAPVELLSAAAGTLTVRIPEHAETGPFVVRSLKGGATMSPRSFIVPSSVRVVAENPPSDENGLLPEPFEIAAGSTIQLLANVVPETAGGDRSVDWFVNGLPGGNPAAGFVTANGLFTAPASVPTGGVVTVTAALKSNPSVFGSLSLLVVAADPHPGQPTMISAARGGVAFSKDHRASVEIPPGALSVDTVITVAEPTDNPPPSSGRRILGSAEFFPAGVIFTMPARVTIPLQRPRTPGAQFPLRFYQPDTGTYLDEGIQATVTDAEDSATALVGRFGVVVVDEPVVSEIAGALVPLSPQRGEGLGVRGGFARAPRHNEQLKEFSPLTPALSPLRGEGEIAVREAKGVAASPVITLIEPNSIREGERLPMRLTGTDLTDDLTVEVRREDGAPAPEIAVDTFLGRDTNAGVLLRVSGIANFDSGTRTYRLRLMHTDGSFDEVDFNVIGLPEIHVAPGQRLELINPAPMTNSSLRVDAGGEIWVRAGKFEVETLGDVQIDGVINAAGDRGGNAMGQQGGVPGREGHGGAGGLGRQDSDGFLFGLDGAEPENYGRNANDALGFSRPFQGPSRPYGPTDREPQGVGGYAGDNLELDVVDIAEDVIECIGSFGIVCAEAAIELANVARQLINIADGGAPGKRGFGAVADSMLDETGGGGGGGGGRIQASIGIPFVPESEVSVLFFGGGGGAGGDGGRDVRIRAQGGVVLGAAGRVTVAGGGGGDSSSRSFLTIDAGPFSTGQLPNMPAVSGGAGGGGKGGTLSVLSGLGIFYNQFEQLDARGGRGGVGGVAYLDPQNQVSRFQLVGDRHADGPLGRRSIHRPFFDPATFRSKVTSRLLLRLTGNTRIVNNDLNDPYEPEPRTVTVQGEAGQNARFEIPFDLLLGQHDGFVLLNHDFNTLSTFATFSQRILVLAVDADNDGLSDDDESDLGTNPNAPDTDGDGLNDGPEMVAGGDPLRTDTDGDGLRDGDEFARGTRLDRRDTDRDGFWDSAEVFLGSNPNVRTNTPAEVFPDTLLSGATHPETAGGAHLSVFNTGGAFGLLGRPADGFGFGLAVDRFGALFIADGPTLRVYDPIVQTNSAVGQFDPAGQSIQCATLTYDPLTKLLYGVELGGAPNFPKNTGQLLRMDQTSGAATRIGAPLAQRIRAVAFDTNGALFAVIENTGVSDALVRLNPTTGALDETLGDLGFASVTGLAFNRAGDLLAVNPIDTESSRILGVDTTHGMATVIGTVARRLSGLAVMPCAAPCLTFAGSSPGWFRPTKLKALDYDGDGRDDLALLAARDSSNIRSSVTFLRSLANGTFLRETNYPLTSPPNTITGDELSVVRLNADAAPDVVSQNYFSTPASVSVFINDGVGNFPPPMDNPTFINLRSIAVGDVTGDNMPDLVGVGDGALLLYPGDGNGAFGNGVEAFSLDPEWFLLAVRLGDVDGDGDLDIVAMDSAVTIVSLNNGNGMFAAPVAATFAYEDNGVELADVNGDGRSDVVTMLVGEDGGFFVQFSLGNGQLSAPVFTSLVSGGASANPQDFTLADLDDDGLPELVFAGNSDHAVHVWLNQGNGTFRPRPRGPLLTPAAQPPLCVAVGDFNGDGKPDIAAGILMLDEIWTWLSE